LLSLDVAACVIVIPPTGETLKFNLPCLRGAMSSGNWSLSSCDAEVIKCAKKELTFSNILTVMDNAKGMLYDWP
jgi:hypothetical protein